MERQAPDRGRADALGAEQRGEVLGVALVGGADDPFEPVEVDVFGQHLVVRRCEQRRPAVAG